MKKHTRRLDVAERRLAFSADEEAALRALARIFALTPEQVAELRQAPAWALEATMAKLEKREPEFADGHIAAHWRVCGCLACEGVRRIIGPTSATCCPLCLAESHPEGSRPHDARAWRGGRLESWASAGMVPPGGCA